MVDTYDAAGRKTKQTVDGVVTTFTYDNADRLLSQQRPGGKSVTYTLDTASNLKTIKAEGAQPVTVQDGPTREASPALGSPMVQSAGRSR